jgi:uncharacterized protein (TIGR02099 family)
MHSEIDVLEQQLPPRERLWWRLARYTGWTLVGLYFLAALGVLGLRFMVLPNIGRYTESIAAAATRALGEKVEIGNVDAEWLGLHPRLELTEVRVVDRDGREALRLPYVGLTVAWRSVLYGRPVFRSLVVDGANLEVRRDPAGRVFVAGMEMKSADEDGSGLAETVLDMRELIIRDAAVVWQDEQRRAPPLRLSDLHFVLENDGARHRFALSADPPRDHASPLDVRGELIGRSLKKLDSWDGRVYAAFDFIDLAVWSAWVDLPLEIANGRGALRLWATLRDWEPKDALADVSLADVSMRLGPDLPPLQLKWVEGRLGARAVLEGFELMSIGRKREVAYEAFGTRLGLETTAGARFEPSTFQARWEPAGRTALPQGTFSASSVDLAPLARIGESVPLPAQAREVLKAAAPEGRLEDVRVSWTGTLDAPHTYSARAGFAALGMQPYGKLPGFARLAGTVEVHEKGGSVAIDARDVAVDYPALLITPRHSLDTLAGKAAWTRTPERLEVRVEQLALANADVAATLAGTYHTTPDSAGHVDLTVRVPRAEGAAVWRYMPVAAPLTAKWIKRGLVAAQASDGKVRMKGDLRNFPFEDPRTGVFEVSARVANGVLDYVDGWPRITGIQAEYAMNAGKLQVRGSRASVLGVQLQKVTATIPDVFTHEPHRLQVEGAAEGPSAEFLRFVASSPLNRITDHALDGWTATGNGRLSMSFDMPLDHPEQTRLSGVYQINGNAITPGIAEIALTQVNGRVELTESSVTARSISGVWLGGPVSFDVTTRAGTTSVTGQGQINVPVALVHFGVPLAKHFSGTTAVRFASTVRGGQATHSLESSLQDVAIDLPPPFAKSPAEAWPLRVERTGGSGGTQLVDVSLAKLLSARLQLRTEGQTTTVERGGVGVGELGVALPDRPGVFVSANLGAIDLDRLLALQDAAGPGTPAFQVAALSLRSPEVIVGGKVFHDVQARALQTQRSRWQIGVNAREVSGDVTYASDGKGAVVAKLKHLVHPESPPGAAEGGGRTLDTLPAIELTAERYVFNERELGRLEVRAVNERRGWRVDRLALASADCKLDANGLWQPPAPPTLPRTSFVFQIEAPDAGKCLARLGHPDAVVGGTAELQGEAEWRGPVYAIHYPTLTGKLSIEATKGQFVKVRPGIGKLLGVLSLQSLPRRVTLDFRDVFSEGFAFDSIRGTAQITAGVMRTDDLAMIGPAANVAMKGEVDIARERQDLTVRVVPVIGDSVAAAAGVALLNPIIGAGALLAQRILKDPIGQMFAFEYRITGGWEEPKVERLAGRASAEAEAPR